MAKLADALDLGSSGALHVGSSPSTRTIMNIIQIAYAVCFFIYLWYKYTEYLHKEKEI